MGSPWLGLISVLGLAVIRRFFVAEEIELRSGFAVTSLEKFVFASHLRKPKITQ